MPTAVTVLIILFAVFVVAPYLGWRLWLKPKLLRGVAWVKVQGLEQGLTELRAKQAKQDPEHPDAELAALIARVEAAHAAAKSALEKGDVDGVSKAADEVLKELIELAEKKAKDEAERRKAEEHKTPEPDVKSLPPATDLPPSGDADNS